MTKSKQSSSLIDRIRYAMVEPHYPNVGIEFDSDCIRLAIATADKGKISVVHLDSEKLPAGAIEINPFKPNIHALEPVAEALKAIWSRSPVRPSRVCLLLQDRTALNFNPTLEHVPANQQECNELIRFKLRKFVPFRIEESKICLFDQAGVHTFRHTNPWVIVLSDAVLHQYEQFVQSTINADCGLVDLCTFNMMNLAHIEMREDGLQAKDVLFVNVNETYISIAIMQKSKLVFYRSRDLERPNNGVVDEALSEIHPITLFYLDKLGGEKLERVFVYSLPENEELTTRIQNEFYLDARPLNIERFTGSRFDPSNRQAREGYVPLVGLLVSRKVEFQ